MPGSPETMRPMSWSLRYQMIVPLAALVAMLIFHISSIRTAHEMGRLDVAERRETADLARTLSPLDAGHLREELEAAKASRPGWNFVAFRDADVLAATLPLEEREREVLASIPPQSVERSSRDMIIDMPHSSDYFWITVTEVPDWPAGTKLVGVYSRGYARGLDNRIITISEILAVSAVSLVILGAVWYSHHLSRRVVRIQEQVERIAAGELHQPADEQGKDEIGRLAKSVNAMAADLDRARKQLRDSERSRLHAQLAGGLGHELRNGIHGAKISLEIYREQLPATEGQTTRSRLLANALRQLEVTGTLISRFLAIGRKPMRQNRTAKELSDILSETQAIVEPIARHGEITFESRGDIDVPFRIDDAEEFRAALINLCMNGMEAAGRGGKLILSTAMSDTGATVQVQDNGPGPPDAIAETLFEPFETTKRDGIGLGLVQARGAVEAERGTLDWRREGDWTVFSIHLPRTDRAVPDAIAPSIAPAAEAHVLS